MDACLIMHFSQYARAVLELDNLLEPIRQLAETCGVPSPEEQHWYSLLKQKLVPQLSAQQFLLVAVMGGTNTGKSLIFNHLAGDAFSAVDYRASGTKHPVCIVPRLDIDVPIETILARYFETFRCIPWSNANQPLELSGENTLFWFEGANVPEKLLLLDTPDFDADRESNWEQAKAVRHAADVVIAVLTEQKYNDAAVRRFFREAAEAGKPLIVLFNMIDSEEDIQHLSRWLEQFRRETGVQPIDVLAAPHDKEKAEKLTLPFYAVREGKLFPIDIKSELNELHFDTIKSQTLLGAIKVLEDPQTGVQSYLDSVEHASICFSDALKTLGSIGETEVQWPGLPSSLLADEIRTWWNSHRPAWSQQVNSVYRKIGGSVLWPIRQGAQLVKKSFKGNVAEEEITVTSLIDFHSAEQRTAIEFIGKVIDKLKTLAEGGNPILRREISELTSGEHRSVLLRRAYSVLDSLPPVDKEFRNLLHRRLGDWTAENPTTTVWIQTLDNVVTAARPLITVSLAVSGFAAGAYLMGHVLGEAAMASGITAGGEAAFKASSEGLSGSAANLFRQIQEDFVLERSRRFSQEFQKELWNNVISRLQAGADVAELDVFKQCRNWKARS